MPDPIALAQRQTIQQIPDAKAGGGGSLLADSASALQVYVTGRARILPPWGTRYREMWLRAYYRHELNTLLQGGVSGLIKKVKSSPWEIVGPKSGTAYYQEWLRNAQFGRGWGEFLSMGLLDYSRQDIGWFAEVIGPGNPSRPMTGRPTGLAHLDALRCYPTGDPDYPVLYRAKDGKSHLMHASRVLHFVDMPDGDEDTPGGVGLCAVSRAAAIIWREMLANRYVEIALDDKPKPGIIVASGIEQTLTERAIAKFNEQQSLDDPGPLGRVMWLYGLQPDNPVKLEQVAFTEPPMGFDYKVYKVDIDVNELALALGVDVQELWQLGGGGARLGTATQSEVLSQKARGRAFGDILKMIERRLNDVLSTRYEFQFKFSDPQEDLETAQKAQMWVSVAAALPPEVPAEYRLKLLANQVEAIADVILDENGQLIRLNDADPKEGDEAPDVDEAVDEEAAAQDDTAQGTEADTQGDDGQQQTERRALKQFSTTRAAFVDLVMDAIQAGQTDGISRRRFGTVMRAHLRKSGLEAYRDGLKDGGVPAEDMDARDEAALAEWLRLQSEYVTKFGARVFSQDLSDAQIRNHAEMWANKSLRDAYQLGQASANWNGMFVWKLGATKEHCEDCARYAGQIHRMRDWRKKKATPGSEALTCRGYQCLCVLDPAPGKRASGRF